MVWARLATEMCDRCRWEGLLQHSKAAAHSCRGHPCNRPSQRERFSPFLVLHCQIWHFEILRWGAYGLRWPRHGHALSSGGFAGRTAATRRWLVHTVTLKLAGTHRTVLWYITCAMTSDSSSLFKVSVICSWPLLLPHCWLQVRAHFPLPRNIFCVFFFFFSVLGKKNWELSENNISVKGCHYLGLPQIAVHSLCDIRSMDGVVVRVLAMVIFLNHNWEPKQKIKILLSLSAMATSGNWI